MSADDPLIGRKLGDYAIVGLLGRGGMSRVYKGFDENLERYAAIKVISGDFATTTEEEYTRRFQSEARAIARLRHPNIVGVYQFGRTEGIYYMAQVFLEGKDLRSLLKEYIEQHRRMPPVEIVRIAKDVGGALDYAHEQGVIHRDIKPSNIMLEKKTNRAILMDFGLALSVNEGTMGDTFGSAHYIAPEQAISSAKSVPQSDLYSLGIVLYEMITGRVPFDDPSVMSVALKHLNEIPPPPSMYNPDLPPAVERVIMRALEKDPTRRYATGAELVGVLEQAFMTDNPSIPAGTPMVADLLESKPKPPPYLPDLMEYTPLPAAALNPAAPAVAPEPKSGLAGRFARRKAEKEVQQALDEGLALDDDTISKLLRNMPDPSEIGLVGEGAKGITLPKPPPDMALELSGQKRRKSRIGLLLALILVIAILAGGWWLGTQSGKEKNKPTEQAGNVPPNDLTQTITAVAALATEAELTRTAAMGQVGVVDLTLTAAVGELTITATEKPTQTPPAVPSRTPEAGSTQTPEVTGAQTSAETVTAEPTKEPAVTPTEQPTQTPSPVLTLTPTGEPTTPAPPVTQTAEQPSPTAALTETPSIAPSPSETLTVELLPTLVPDVRLVYDQGQFLLANISDKRLDVSQLVFEQDLPDGSQKVFKSNAWPTQGLVDAPNRMRAQSCYQLVTADADQVNPSRTLCPVFLGYYQTGVTQYYFWISNRSGAVFTVRNGDTAPVLATCTIAAGMCDFSINAAPPVTKTPTKIPPTAVPTQAPTALTPSAAASSGEGNLRLLYNKDAVLLVNVSNQALDVSGLTFRQVLPNGSLRHFEASDWNLAGVLAPPSQMPAKGCYQFVTAEGTQANPERSVCTSLLGWYTTWLTERYFWISSQAGATFNVYLDGDTTPLGTCQIDAGECWITLPQ